MNEVGLLVGLKPPAHWSAVVHSLRGWCLPRVADPAATAMDAWLASAPNAPGLARVLASGAVVGVLAEDEHPFHERPTVFRITTDAAAAASDPNAVLFPVPGVDAAASLPVTPFLRARWRRRFGLPRELVIGTESSLLDDELVPTALALASAVVARGHQLVEALAWGAPCVTDQRSASDAGAAAGVEVVVADPDRAEAEARLLAGDDRRAAALGRAGRRLVERRHDTAGAAKELARRLGVVPAHSDPLNRLEDRLDELWTPPRAHIRRRAADALAGLLPAVG